MKVIGEAALSIPAVEMKDGEIAIVTRWSSSEWVGRVVQCYDTTILGLGMTSQHKCFKSSLEPKEFTDCWVRILPPGTKLEI